MTTTRLVAAALVAAWTLAWAAPAAAAERNYWRHSQGHFENTHENEWTEKAPGGKTFHFAEKVRPPEYVELYNRPRGVTVRLYKTHCTFKQGDGETERLYEGGWRGPK